LKQNFHDYDHLETSVHERGESLVSVLVMLVSVTHRKYCVLCTCDL